MNKIYRFSAMLFWGNLFFFTASAQPANFLGAAVTEDLYPLGPSDVPYMPGNVTAYSYGGLNAGGSGGGSDLYVYTWDADSLNYPCAGLAVREYAAGTPVNSGTAPVAEDNNPAPFWNNTVQSTEAVILQDAANNIYILVAYYQNPRFAIDFYQWTGGSLVHFSGPQNITVNGSVPFGRIHLDAINLDRFVITWEESGRIYAKAGTVTTGINIGNTVELDNSTIGGAALQPDVALMNQVGGSLKAHFAYTNPNQNRLYVTTLDFNTLFSAPPPSPSPVLLSPVLADLQNTTGRYESPRIDAPDNLGSDDWSYVVAEHLPTSDIISAGVKAGASLQHFRLNDGSLGNPAIAVTVSGLRENNRPVVAYDNTGQNLYYCWHYKGAAPYMPDPNSDRAYVGLKMTNTGILLGGPLYWRAQANPTQTSSLYGIALSPQNDASPELFMAFLQNLPVTGDNYAIGVKTVAWSATQFRPGPLSLTEMEGAIDLQAYPNPFYESFRLKVDKTNKEIYYKLLLSDPLWHRVLSLEGTIEALNRQLAGAMPLLPSGIYFLDISGQEDKSQKRLKVVKIK